MKPTVRSKSEAAPEPAPAPAPAAPVEAVAPQVRFKNRQMQVLVLQVADAAGRLQHREIQAQGSLLWPAAPTLSAYGPDVATKLRARLLSIEPA